MARRGQKKDIRDIFDKKWDDDATLLCTWLLNWTQKFIWKGGTVAESCKM